MKFLHYLFGFVLFVLLIALAGGVIYAALVPAVWQFVVSRVEASRLYAVAGAAAILVIVLLYLATGCRRKRPEQFISFENEGGAVSISIKAIRDFLSRLADEFAAVISLDPIIRAPSGTIEVELDVTVKSGTQIPELCRLLQDRVKESIRDNLGLPEVKSVKISVREIVAQQAGHKASDTAADWENPVRP